MAKDVPPKRTSASGGTGVASRTYLRERRDAVAPHARKPLRPRPNIVARERARRDDASEAREGGRKGVRVRRQSMR